MLRRGDRFEWNGIVYEVLDILMAGASYYYKVRGSCGAIKILPESVERQYSFRRL